MPFFRPAKKIKKTGCVSLQVHKSKKSKIKDFSYLNCKRACLFTSKGSITIEAAIATAIFMIIILFAESFLLVIHTEFSMQIHINNIVQDVAKSKFYMQAADKVSDSSQSLSYVKEQIKVKEENFSVEANKIGILTEGDINAGYLWVRLATNIKQGVSDDSAHFCKVTGMNVSDSTIQDEMVDMIVKYQLKIPYVNKYLRICQRGRVKDWTGTDITGDNNLVYITKEGTVYHTTKECSHLVVKIRKAYYSEIKSLRNSNGQKYKKCEYCVGKISNETAGIFITEDGTKYHTSLQCQGLKRNVIAIDITQVGEKKPCSRCGQGG